VLWLSTQFEEVSFLNYTDIKYRARKEYMNLAILLRYPSKLYLNKNT
jgi:hypothetical protein